jgi:hypothetical protein
MTVSYVPEKELLELYSLNECVVAFIGSNQVRELELFTQVGARDCHEVLSVKVWAAGKFVLNTGQTLICECES